MGDGIPAATVSANSLKWVDTTVNKRVFYYIIRAADNSEIESGDSVIADSSRDENIIVVSEDQQAIAVIPEHINGLLYSENNSYGSDLRIVM
ncbi:unnamed protein product, partial [marine sediment metagenome]